MENTQKIKYILLFFVLLLVFFSAGNVVNAANLYFSPSSGSGAVGSILSATVYVSSPDQAMNAASGVISFPQDKLEVVSISKAGSIFSLWVQEPSFSNSEGTVNFEGIILNPGFVGSSGKVITVSFKIKAPGVANLNFPSGSMLANDGQGTNILKSLGSAQFSLDSNDPTVPESTTPTIIYGVPSAPEISSPTHPDPNSWYSKKDASFEWKVPADATAVRLSVGELPRSTPTVVYSPAVSKKEMLDLNDGIHYFHAQFRNSKGWGEISHFRFQIDTEPPEQPVIKFIDGNKTENPRPTVVFDATDSLSGIDYYKIKISEGDFFSLSLETVKSNPYTLPPQSPGKRNILVQAFDKAGNYSVATDEFTIKPLESPIFTEYSKELTSGETFIAKGSTYPNSKVTVWLKMDKENERSFIIKSGQDGKFTFVSEEKMQDGIYKFWAEVEDDRGAKSLPGEKITIKVLQSAFLRIGSWAVSFFAVLIPLIALIVLIIVLVWYSWHKFLFLKKRIRKETREASSAVSDSFNLLKENVQETIKILERTHTKRELTKEEDKILKQFKRDLEDAEKFVKKEVEDIGKLVK